MLTVSFATNRTIQISFHLKKSYKFFSVIVAGLLQLERTIILGGSNMLLSLSGHLCLAIKQCIEGDGWGGLGLVRSLSWAIKILRVISNLRKNSLIIFKPRIARNLHQKKIVGLVVEFEPEQKTINSFNYHVDVP